MPFSSKKIFFYILAFLLFTPVFYFSGLYLGMSFFHKEMMDSPFSHPPRINKTNHSLKENIATLSGVVRPQVIPDSGRGTHQLEGIDGQLIAFLKSNNIELSLLEGSWVTVEGIAKKVPDLKIDLIEVKKIRLK